MKRLRKLLGILLTGVMALTLLAGCAGTASLNEKEILEGIKDYYKMNGDTAEDDTINYARKAADFIKARCAKDPNLSIKDFASDSQSDEWTALRDAVVPSGSNDIFVLSVVAVEPYQYSYYQKHQNALLAARLCQRGRDGHFTLLYYSNRHPSTSSDEKVFVSICIETINEKTYAFSISRVAQS